MRSSLLLSGALVALALAAACNNSSLTTAGKQPTPSPTPRPNRALPPLPGLPGNSGAPPATLNVFDGSNSYDPDGSKIASWAWSLTSVPSGSQAAITAIANTAAKASFTPDVAGDYTIQLMVADTAGLTDTATLQFGAVPVGGLRVELAWPTQYGKIDLDNHLLNMTQSGSPSPPPFFTASASATQEWDCFFGDCTPTSSQPAPTGYGYPLPDWYAAGAGGDDPHQNGDNINQSFPEDITIQQPANGTYLVGVHYYQQLANGPKITPVFTVTVYAN